MSANVIRLSFVAAAAFALSGCGMMQSVFGGPHSARTPEYRVATTVDPEVSIVLATDEGRRHLDRGETGLAIEAFRRALSAGPPTAPALNGMGVAFARLGRHELAYRYFSQAAMLDPANERYAANLMRLTGSPAFAMRYNGELASAVINSAATESVAEVASATALTDAPPPRLTRVSASEYEVRTVAPSAAPLIKRSDSRFKPLVRIEFSKPDAFKANPSANHSGRSVITNPHVGEKMAAVDPRFQPIVRLELKNTRRTTGPAD